MPGPHNPSIQSLPPTDWSLKRPVPTRRAGPGPLRAYSLRPTAYSLSRGFTLTELLIVIAIIGVLASLIAVAAKAALDNSSRARIILDAKNIGGALESFKNDFGAYPPNAMNSGGAPDPGTTLLQASNDFTRMMKKAFPRMNPQEIQVVRALAGEDMSGGLVTSDQLDGGLTAAESLVFWLGGFSDDPQFPLSGPGGPSFETMTGTGEILENRKRRYEFDFTRFAPRADDGTFDDTVASRFVTYNVNLNGDNDTSDAGEERRINLWQYRPGKSEQPMLYFDTSRYKPAKYDPPAEPNGDLDYVYALKQYRQGKNADSSPLTMNDFTFVNQGKFQLIHSGLDDDWGDFGESASNTTDPADLVVLYPAGPFVGANADTLTNFADGKLEDAAE
jgi:prepilin-type N-terminal cleavage/methylation domain-containing protein